MNQFKVAKLKVYIFEFIINVNINILFLYLGKDRFSAMSSLHSIAKDYLLIEDESMAYRLCSELIHAIIKGTNNNIDKFEPTKGQLVILDVLLTLLTSNNENNSDINLDICISRNRDQIIEIILNVDIPWSVLPALCNIFVDVRLSAMNLLMFGKKIVKSLSELNDISLPPWLISSLVKYCLLFAQTNPSNSTSMPIVLRSSSNVMNKENAYIWIWIQALRMVLNKMVQLFSAEENTVEPANILCVIDMYTHHSFTLAANIIKFYKYYFLKNTSNDEILDVTVNPRKLYIGSYDIILLSYILKIAVYSDVSLKLMAHLLLSIKDIPKAMSLLNELVCICGVDSRSHWLLKFASHLCKQREKKKGEVKESIENSEKAKLLAQHLLLTIFDKHEYSRGDILAYCFSLLSDEACRVYGRFGGASKTRTSGLTNLENFLCSTLEKIASQFLPYLRNYITRIQEWISYLPSSITFSPGVSKRILTAFLPLVKISNSFRSRLIILMKKFLASKSASSCSLAHQCFCELLKYEYQSDDKQEEQEIFHQFNRSLKLPISIRIQLYNSLLDLLYSFSLSNPKESILDSIGKVTTSQLSKLFGSDDLIEIENCYERLSPTNHIRAKESLIHLFALITSTLSLNYSENHYVRILRKNINHFCDIPKFIIQDILGYQSSFEIADSNINTIFMNFKNNELNLPITSSSNLEMYNAFSIIDTEDIPNEKIKSKLSMELRVSIFSPVYLLIAECFMKGCKPIVDGLKDPTIDNAKLKAIQIIEIRSALLYIIRKIGMNKKAQQFKLDKYETILSVNSILSLLEEFLNKNSETKLSISAVSDMIAVFLNHLKQWEYHQALIKTNGSTSHSQEEPKIWIPIIETTKVSVRTFNFEYLKRMFVLCFRIFNEFSFLSSFSFSEISPTLSIIYALLQDSKKLETFRDLKSNVLKRLKAMITVAMKTIIGALYKLHPTPTEYLLEITEECLFYINRPVDMEENVSFSHSSGKSVLERSNQLNSNSIKGIKRRKISVSPLIQLASYISQRLEEISREDRFVQIDSYINLIKTLINSVKDRSFDENEKIASICNNFVNISESKSQSIKSLLEFIFDCHPNITYTLELSSSIVKLLFYSNVDEDSIQVEESECYKVANNLCKNLSHIEEAIIVSLSFFNTFLTTQCSNYSSWLEKVRCQSEITKSLFYLCDERIPKEQRSVKIWAKLISVAQIIYTQNAKYLGKLSSCGNKMTDFHRIIMKYNDNNWITHLCELSSKLRSTLKNIRSSFAKNLDKRIPSLLSKMDVFDVQLKQLYNTNKTHPKISKDLKAFIRKTIKFITDSHKEEIVNEENDEDSDESEPIVRGRRTRKSKLRSRNAFIDSELRFETGDDDYADLEDFIEI